MLVDWGFKTVHLLVLTREQRHIPLIYSLFHVFRYSALRASTVLNKHLKGILGNCSGFQSPFGRLDGKYVGGLAL